MPILPTAQATRAPFPSLDRTAFRAVLEAAVAARETLRERLEQLGKAKRVLVYSFGVRGRDLAQQLRDAGVECVIYDRAASAMDQAAAAGFETTTDLGLPIPLIVGAGQNQVEVLDGLGREAFSLAEALYAFDLRNSYGRARAFTEFVAGNVDALFAQYETIEAPYRAAFLDVLSYRASLDVRRTDATRRPLVEMWRPPAVVSDIRSFCDVGAYDGDSLSAVKSVYPMLERSFTVEPNPGLAERIAETARSNGLSNTNYIGGAWRRPARLSTFHQLDGVLAIREDSEGEIQSDTLDSVTQGATYDYVKLDIESAEAAAIEGAASLLRRAKCIAVAAYHLPGDLIELPRQMGNILGDANGWRCAFQHYSQSFDDSIYYFYR